MVSIITTTAVWAMVLSSATPQTIMVLPTEPTDEVSTELAGRFDAAIHKDLEGRGLEVQTPETLARPEEIERCDGDPACLAERLPSAPRVLVSSLGRVGEAWIASVSVLDLGSGRVAGRSGASGATFQELEAEVPSLVGRALESGDSVTPAVALPDKPTFVLLPVEGAGLPEGTAENLTQVIAKELQRINGASVISKEEVEVMLGVEQLRRVLDQDCDRSCFNRIAGALDADYVVVARVGQLGTTFVVQLNAIDQRGGDEARRHSETFEGTAEELIRATRHATQTLFGLLDGDGSLAVSASPEGAVLLVNGEEVGTLPLAPREGLNPGRYTVRLQRDGFLPYRSDVYVNPDGTSVVWAELERAPERWYEKWWVWTLVGVVVAGAATGVTLAATSDTPTTSSLDVSFE